MGNDASANADFTGRWHLDSVRMLLGVLVKCMSRDWLAISTPELRYTSTRAPWEYERRNSLAGFTARP